jgi:hypothetical protein
MKMASSNERWHRWIAVFLLAMAVTHIIVFWQQRKPIASGYGDFSAFYTAGRMVQRGMGSQLYSPQEQWKVQQEFASQVAIRHGPMPFVRPPFEALIFLPFSYFTYPVALAIWSAMKFGCLWLALWILPREFPFTRVFPPWFEAVLCIGFFPVFLDLYQGQDAMLLLLLFVCALRSLQLEKDAFGGAFLALALFKFHLVIPIVIVLILVGRRRVLAGFLPTALALVAVSAAIAGPAVLRTYPSYLLDLNRTAGVGMVTAQSMPNLRGLLTAWVGRSPYPGPIHWILLPMAVAAIAFTVWVWRFSAKAGFCGVTLGLSLALVVAILTSYYAYSYDITLLLIPILLLGGGFLKQVELTAITRSLLISGLLLLICTPLYWVLVLTLDRPYLLVIPILLLGFGIAHSLQELRRARYVAVPVSRE